MLPDLVQEALNAEHATFPMASELQVMSSMSNRASRYIAAQAEPEWDKIKDEIQSPHPRALATLKCSFGL